MRKKHYRPRNIFRENVWIISIHCRIKKAVFVDIVVGKLVDTRDGDGTRATRLSGHRCANALSKTIKSWHSTERKVHTVAVAAIHTAITARCRQNRAVKSLHGARTEASLTPLPTHPPLEERRNFQRHDYLVITFTSAREAENCRRRQKPNDSRSFCRGNSAVYPACLVSKILNPRPYARTLSRNLTNSKPFARKFLSLAEVA